MIKDKLFTIVVRMLVLVTLLGTTLLTPLVQPTTAAEEPAAKEPLASASGALQELESLLETPAFRPTPSPAGTPATRSPTLEPAPEAPPYPFPEQIAGRSELVRERTAHSAVFDMGDGSYALVRESQPLHYRDAEGNWQRINPAFAGVTNGWINATNALQTSLARERADARITAEQIGVGWETRALVATSDAAQATPLATRLETGDGGTRSSDGRIIEYDQGWNVAGIQERWESGFGQVEYSLLLPQPPQPIAGAAHLELRAYLHLMPGTYVEIDGEALDDDALPRQVHQALAFVDALGHRLWLLPPQAYEQGDAGERVNGSYTLAAAGAEGDYELRVQIPWAWLADPQRRYPVVIDPTFQMRNGTTVLAPLYDSAHNFLGYYSPGMGQFSNGIQRLLVKFDLPTMPSDTTINKAYLIATPTGQNVSWDDSEDDFFLNADVELYTLNNSSWVSNSSFGYIDDAHTSLIGSTKMAFSNGDPTHPTSGVWDITTQARQWGSLLGANYGLMLKTARESCKADRHGCGGFYFDQARGWTDDELEDIEKRSEEDYVYIPHSNTGGVRLLVFFAGPSLSEGQVLPPDGNRTSAPSSGDPYYHAGHEYRLNSSSNKWVAAVTRGYGNTFGVSTPDDYTDVYGRHTEGSLPLQLTNSGGAASLPKSENDMRFQPHGSISYIILDGRDLSSQNYYVRVHPPAAEAVPSRGYDIRLITEEGSVQVKSNGTTQSSSTAFHTDTPLHLWNLDFSGLPAGSNVRVQVAIQGSNANSREIYDYARNFGAYMFDDDDDQNLYGLGSDGRIDLKGNAPPSGLLELGHLAFNSPIFAPDGANYLLALDYNGPDIYRILDRVCSGEFCHDEINPLYFIYRLNITACAQGAFPTKDGRCQQINCPSSSGRAYSRLRLWSQAGFSTEGQYTVSNDGESAPLIGGPDSNDAPTVAVVGGQIRYQSDGTGTSLELTDDSTVLIIDCRSLSNPRSPLTADDYFSVYDGPMDRIPVGDDDALSPPFRNNVLDPWAPGDVDSGEANIYHYRLFPDTGVLKSRTLLTRHVGDNGDEEIRFWVDYEWDVDGWPSLTVNEVSRITGSGPLDVASMLLDLGTALGMDIQPAGGKNDTRQFRALRASDATITLPAELGGDSSDVQALILPRGQPTDPTEPEGACSGSCIDLRAPDDTSTSPRRNWTMPDVHTNVQAGTVIYNTAGNLQVYSVDHPLASQADAPKEYSFDTAAGSVSIRRAPCTEGGPIVTIVEGETQLAMPNIGADPTSMVAAQFKLCGTALRRASFQFKTSSGIPIGNSGLFLTGMNGQVDILPSYTQINFGMDFAGGNSNVIAGHGEVTIDTRGYFEFAGQAKLLGTVDADGKLWVAWNPMDIGFEVSVGYKEWLRGTARAHMWVGQGWLNKYSWLPNNNERHMAAQIGATIRIKKGQAFSWWFIDIPPSTINFSIEVAFGEFCTNSDCSRYEWGVKGKFRVAGYNVGLYYGFDHGFDFILGNDKHVLIDQHWGSAPAMAAMSADGLNVRPAAQALAGVATESFEVGPGAEELLVALGWQTGAPTLTVYDADGVDVTTQYTCETQTTANSILLGVQIETPKPGSWRAEIGNLAGEENYKFVAFSNKGAPGTAANPGSFLAPVSENEPGTGSYIIQWQVPDDTPDSATISLYYSHVYDPRFPPAPFALLEDIPIVKNLPFKTGRYTWDTTGIADGDYRIRAVVDDGVNDFPEGQICDPDDVCSPDSRELPPARAFSPERFPGLSTFSSGGTVLIEDAQAPSEPGPLVLRGVDGAVLARWTPPSSRDVTGYVVRWGEYNAGASTWGNYEETWITALEHPVYRIGGVENGQTITVGVFAVDAAGNWSPAQIRSKRATSTTANQVPGDPIHLHVDGEASTQLRVSWDAPAGDVPVSGYRVNYNCLYGPLVKMQSVETLSNSITLTGLESAAVYEITVQAHHDGFYGEASRTSRSWAVSSADANGDEVPDEWSAAYGVQDANADDDGDGLINIGEYGWGGNPTLQDSDEDGFSDLEEVQYNTDLLNQASFPAEYLYPRLNLGEDRLTFHYKQGASTSTSQHVEIFNDGGDALPELVISSQETWLQDTVFVMDPQTYAFVNVRVSPAGLEPGYYSGVVRVDRSPQGDILVGGGKCIRVELWVSPPDGEINPRNWEMIYLPLVVKNG